MLCSFREISFPRNLYREELWLLLMRTTNWLSCRKPNRPHSEVTHPNSLNTSLPLSVYFVARLAFPCHHIGSTTTNWSKCKLEKLTVLHCALASGTNKQILRSLLVATDAMRNVVLCCFTVLNIALRLCVEIRASRSSLHPNDWPHRVSVCLGNPPSADGVLIGVAVALPFSRKRESRTSESCQSEALPTLLSEDSRLQDWSLSKQDLGCFRENKKARERKTKKGSATL